MWLLRHPWIVYLLALVMVLPQTAALFTGHWQGDFDQWFAILALIVLALWPVAFLYGRWRSGPEGYERFKESGSVPYTEQRKRNINLALWISLGILILVIVALIRLG